MWLKHPAGRISENLANEVAGLYAFEPRAVDIKPARQGLTSLAVQLVEQKVSREAEKACRSKDIRIRLRSDGRSDTGALIQWEHAGSGTQKFLRDFYTSMQPIGWHLVKSMSARKRHGVHVDREHRPLDTVLVNIFGRMSYSQSSRANRGPLAEGLLYFSVLAPVEIFRMQSCIAGTPSLTTCTKAMECLSSQELAILKARGEDPDALDTWRIDNVHNYHLQRDMALGRQNKLFTGIFGASFEAEDYVNVNTFDLDRFRDRLAASRADEVTVDDLAALVDQKHLQTVIVLQFVRAVTEIIPEMKNRGAQVTELYRKHATKLQLPVKKTKVHPFSACSKNEITYTELRDCIVDFMEQSGQTSSKYKNRKQPIGGDGLTVIKGTEMQSFLQFEDNPFDSHELFLWLTEGWHLNWTDLCSIFSTFYGAELTMDPSTIGHSATKLERRRPADLSKVDFNEGVQLLFLVLDCRMLDCLRVHLGCDDIFEYFHALGKSDTLPSTEELFKIAKKLALKFTSNQSYTAAISGNLKLLEKLGVPVHQAWDGEVFDDSSKDFGAINHRKRAVHTGAKKCKPRSQASKGKNAASSSVAVGDDDNDDEFIGDRVYATSRALLRKSILAAAIGDPGRVYEVTKHQLFTLAGSGNSNYTDLLIDKILMLEEDVDEEMKTAILQISLVNLSGQEGGFTFGDLVQEYYNRLLDAVVRHKGVEYGDTFIRRVWSPNIHRVRELKREWFEGFGLKAKSGRHTAANIEADIKTLLHLYRNCQLHSFIPGRKIGEKIDADRFTAGYNIIETRKLNSHKRKRRIRHAAFHDGLSSKSLQATSATITVDPNKDADGEPDTQEESSMHSRPLMMAQVIDGVLITAPIDVDEDAQELLGLFELDGQDSDDDSDSDEDSGGEEEQSMDVDDN
ncbi:hypothetical protein VNI00_017413 [Paramarasmius palmivorus]|uniref:DUF6589 domain-containing protein n=1 Tax=Paramarasmius palmivorus TaxID=297713 RepID=A0AAW0B646_9AGAR